MLISLQFELYHRSIKIGTLIGHTATNSGIPKSFSAIFAVKCVGEAEIGGRLRLVLSALHVEVS